MTREEKEQWDIFMKTWVISALKNTWNEKKCKEIVEALNEWEEQEPWISVGEKVPERSGEYLVSVIDGSGDDIDYEAVGVAWFAHKKDYNIKESEWRELGIDEIVIAWMPLPKAYERVEE